MSGNGQFSWPERLAGVIPRGQGDVLLNGYSIAGSDEVPSVGLVAGAAVREPCAPELSLLANLEVLEARRISCSCAGTTPVGAARPARTLRRAPRDLELPAGALSGGNLQKLVVARELARAPRLVIACYPTMGLDLGAAAAVVSSLLAAAAGGAAVVWISEDLDALLAHADRVAVLHRGRMRGPIPVAEATRQGLGAWMTGAEA